MATAVHTLCSGMLGLVVLAGCATTRVRDAEGGYSIDVPPPWTMQEGQRSVRISAQGPASQANPAYRSHLAVAVEPLTHEQSLAEFRGRSVGELGRALQGFEVLDVQRTEIARRQAVRMVYAYEHGRQALTMLTYLLVDDRLGFVLSCGAPTEVFRELLPECEHVIATFRFE